jgi:hypothetical protein
MARSRARVRAGTAAECGCGSRTLARLDIGRTATLEAPTTGARNVRWTVRHGGGPETWAKSGTHGRVRRWGDNARQGRIRLGRVIREIAVEEIEKWKSLCLRLDSSGGGEGSGGGGVV